MNGLASAQAAYDSAEPSDGYYFTDAESDRIAALVADGLSAIRTILKEDLGDYLSDIWSPDDSDEVRDAVQDSVLEEITGALG